MIQKWLASLLADTTDNVLLGRDGQPGGRGMMNFIGDWLTPKAAIRATPDGAAPEQCSPGVRASNASKSLRHSTGRPMRRTTPPGRTPSPEPRTSASTTPRHTYGNGDSALEVFPLMVGMVRRSCAGCPGRGENVIRVRNQGHLDSGLPGTYFL